MELKLKSLLCLLICSSLSTTSFSATRTWDGTAFLCGGNDFSSPACWTAFIVPGSADTAIFSSSGGGTVNFNSSTTNNETANVSSNYTWQLNSNRYNVSFSMNVNNNARLNLTGNSTGIVDVGELSISDSSRIVNTSSSRLIADTLSLQSGGDLFSTSGRVGSTSTASGRANSIGNATVTGTGSEWDTGSLTVANSRTLTASSGGFVDVGGPLSIQGAGRAVTTDGGRIEAGSIMVESNGDLLSTSGFVGVSSAALGSASSLGDATITGSGSEWDTGSLTVTGSRTLVTDSRTLTASSGGFVDVGGTLRVQDSGRVVTTAGGRIEAGALILSNNGDLFSNSGVVGSTSTASSSATSIGSATVTGTGSEWDTRSLMVLNSRTLTVSSGGFVDVGGALRIRSLGRASTTGGGRIEAGDIGILSNGNLLSTSGVVGGSSGASGSATSIGSATVTGVGSEWDTGSLTVTNGRSLTASSGGFVDVAGSLTVQNSSRAFTTGGGRIEAGSLTLSSNGNLFSTTGVVGSSSTASGSANSFGNVLVTGSGSEWDTGALTVLSGRTLRVSSGGFVDVAGSLTVQDSSRAFTTDSGRIEAGSLTLSSSGHLFSTSGVVGSSSGASGSATSIGSATVTGTGSKWDTGSLAVANSRTLTASSGGFVDVAGILSIQSAGRVVTTGNGRIEAGNILVQSNGDLFSTIGTVGSPSGASGSANSIGSATVTGTGSKWDTGSLVVLNSRTLTASSGGFVDVVGVLNIQSAGRAVTTGNGRIEAGNILVQSNGDLFSSIGLVGFSSGASGSASSLGDATVTGTGSKWDTGSLAVANSRTLTVSRGGFVEVGGILRLQSSGRASTIGGGRIEADSIVVESNGDLLSTSGRVGSISTTAGSATSLDNALVDGSGAKWTIRNSLVVDNNKTLTVSNGGLVDVALNLGLSGGGDLVVDNATVNAGNLNVSGIGSVLNMTAASINADVSITNASLTGTGIITGNVTGIGAEFGPGNSPGLLTIDGDFSQDINSSILFELAGTTAISEYDVLDISGTANLAGELVVDWFDNGGGLFSASEGDVFDILSAETIIGEFDLLTLAVLSEGLGWDVSYLLDEFGTTDVLRLSVINTSAVPVPASVWLFGSGLLGLIGVARRKQA